MSIIISLVAYDFQQIYLVFVSENLKLGDAIVRFATNARHVIMLTTIPILTPNPFVYSNY